MNIIIIVVILIAEVLAGVTAIRRRTIAGEIKVHGTLVVPEAVRKIQPIRITLIEGVEVGETE